MSISRAEVVDYLANMTVLELSTLIKELEEKFGVTAAAPMAMMAAGPMAAEAAPAAEAAAPEAQAAPAEEAAPESEAPAPADKPETGE